MMILMLWIGDEGAVITVVRFDGYYSLKSKEKVAGNFLLMSVFNGSGKCQ
jgi:hypothetical protein